MSWGEVAYVVSLGAAGFISAAVAHFAWQRRSGFDSTCFAALMVATTAWSFGYALELLANDLSTKILLAKIEYLAIVAVPVLWFAFTVHYTDRQRLLTPVRIILLLVVPLVTLVLVWSNEAHGLIWATVKIEKSGSLMIFAKTYGVGFFVHAAYAYIMITTGAGILLHAAFQLPSQFRGQFFSMIVATFTPMAGNFLTITGISPFPNLDLTPFGFTITGLVIALGLFRYRLFDIIPVARDYVIENMPDLVIVLDDRNRIVDANPAARRILGTDDASLIGMPIQQALPDHSEFVNPCKTGEKAKLEIVLSKDRDKGHYYHYHVSLSPLCIRRDGPSGCLMVFRDITQRKHAEEELRRAHNLLEQKVKERTAEIRSILEASPDAITVADLEGNLAECNRATLNIHGYSSKEEVVGKNVFDLIARKDHQRALMNLKRTLEEGITRNTEYALMRRDGSEFPGEVSTSIIRDPSGSPSSFVAISKDITERKRAEEQLKQYSEQLEALVEKRTRQLRDAERMATIGEITTMVGHDLRNPLQAIVYNLYLAKERLRSSMFEGKNEVNETLEIIRKEIEYMNKIVLDLQDYARPVKPATRETDMKELIRSTFANLAIPVSVVISTQFDEELPHLMVDPGLMRRVLTNLVTNAIQAMPNGGKLTIDVCADDENATIRIKDTGVGIPKENLDKLFQPLFTTKSKGQGFGLPVCKRLVEAHGGNIDVQSRVNKGSTFTIQIPLEKYDQNKSLDGLTRTNTEHPGTQSASS